MTNVKVNIQRPHEADFINLPLYKFFIYGGDLWLKVGPNEALKLDTQNKTHWGEDCKVSPVIELVISVIK